MLPAVLPAADRLIHRLGRPLAGDRADPNWRTLALVVLVAGPVYGAFMGSFELSSDRLLMVLYSAIKVPLLIFATSLVCLPGFFAFNTVAGLRSDFGKAVRAILAGQAALTVALASLSPLTRLVYVSGANYRSALLFNAAMFTCAACAAQVVMRRRYGDLIAASPGHRAMLWTWLILYAFVGIQMGWMLRPFIGMPEMHVAFFRPEPFSNAYVYLLRLVFGP